MDRRSLLRLLGLSVAGLAGCASSDSERGDPPTRPGPATVTPEPEAPTPTPSPTPSPTPTPTPERFVDGLQPSLRNARATESSAGQLQALVPVENTTDQSIDATLVVTIEGSGEEYSARTAISVPANASREYTVTFDVAWSTAVADGDPIIREILAYNPVYRSA